MEEVMKESSSSSSSSVEVMMMPRVIRLLSSLLQRVAELNDDADAKKKKKKMNKQLVSMEEQQQQERVVGVSVFEGLTRPSISIQSYMERIFKYANCSPSCFVVAYVYLDRFAHRHPSIPINSFNVHRLLITSVLVAAKFLDDMYYNNAYYAKVGGISTTEMNYLEVDFLFGLSFHLNVTPTTFTTYCSYLQREMLLIESPPLNLGLGRSLKITHFGFNEDDQSTHQKQLAAV